MITVQRLHAGRASVAVYFALAGATFGTWAGRVPAVMEQVGLSPGQLGAALAAWSAAAVLALPVTGALVRRVGSPTMALASLLAFTACLALLPVVSTVGLFTLVLCVFGAANSGLDVAINQAACPRSEMRAPGAARSQSRNAYGSRAVGS